MKNFYETLEISQDASADEIEAGYHKMLEIHHEEISADPRGLRWCFIQIARDNLLDDEKRAKHDRDLAGVAAPVTQNTQSVQPAEVQAAPVAPTQKPAQPQYQPPISAPAQAAPYVNPENPKNPAVLADGSDNLLKHVSTPVINWEAMLWFNKDYSRFHEKIMSRQPGLKKGFFGTVAFFLSIFLVAVYANTFPFPQLKGFPVNVLFAVLASVAWYKYYQASWGKKRYFTAVGIFSALSVSSILFGKHSGSSIVLAVVIALVCVLTAYLGLVGADNARRWTSIVSSRQIIRRKLPAKEIKANTTWGKAGELDDAVDKFGAQAVALGSAGEKFTAEFMERLLKIPGTRIFHGLEFPGSENADVDHAIINGDKIAFVDSKMWKAGNYSWGWDGVIDHEDRGVKNTMNSNFHHAVLGYKRKLPEAQIRSHILIHSASGRPVIVDNSNAARSKNPSDPVTKMISAQDFFDEIGEWFSEGTPGYINKSLMSALFSKLKSS